MDWSSWIRRLFRIPEFGSVTATKPPGIHAVELESRVMMSASPLGEMPMDVAVESYDAHNTTDANYGNGGYDATGSMGSSQWGTASWLELDRESEWTESLRLMTQEVLVSDPAQITHGVYARTEADLEHTLDESIESAASAWAVDELRT